MITNIPFDGFSETVAPGVDSTIISAPPIGTTIGVSPGSAGTMTIQYSVSPRAAIDTGTAVWRDWDLGAVSTASVDVLDGAVTALRAVATVSNGTWEVQS